jgi:hypothetical protein
MNVNRRFGGIQGSTQNFRDLYCHQVKKSEPTGHHHPRSSPLPRVCTVPRASAIFLKCILEVVISKGVQHRMSICLDRLICVKIVAFQFYLQSGKQRKVGRVGDDSHVVFGNKFHGEKGNVRRCVVVMQQPVLLSPRFRGEVFAYFHTVAVKRHSSMRNWLFGLPGRILCEQSSRCQRKWWACSWLCSSPVSPFSVSVGLDFPCTDHASFSEPSSNHCQNIRRTFPRSAQNLMVPL